MKRLDVYQRAATSLRFLISRTVLPVKDEGFFDYLRTLDGSSVQLYGALQTENP